jgi:hypothetical protein
VGKREKYSLALAEKSCIGLKPNIFFDRKPLAKANGNL